MPPKFTSNSKLFPNVCCPRRSPIFDVQTTSYQEIMLPTLHYQEILYRSITTLGWDMFARCGNRTENQNLAKYPQCRVVISLYVSQSNLSNDCDFKFF